MKTILITGVDGFLGRNLVEAWLKKYQLLGIDLPNAKEKTSWESSINQVDLRDASSNYAFLLQGVDVVIHCAARTRINQSWNDFDDYYNTNITGSQRLFKACQENGVKKFIYISSSSVYGNSEQLIQSESDSLLPSNPYAVSKVAAELALKAQRATGSTELIIVRPFTMYGEHMTFGKYGLVISKFIQARINDEPLMLDGGGDQTRDFLHVSDAVAALDILIEKGVDNETYNLGTGTSVSIKELADIVSPKQVKGPHRPGPVYRTCANISKLQQLGYQPKIMVQEWLHKYIKEHKL